jgi:hypothetical protein
MKNRVFIELVTSLVLEIVCGEKYGWQRPLFNSNRFWWTARASLTGSYSLSDKSHATLARIASGRSGYYELPARRLSIRKAPKQRKENDFLIGKAKSYLYNPLLREEMKPWNKTLLDTSFAIAIKTFP